jgi:hypothetical protein
LLRVRDTQLFHHKDNVVSTMLEAFALVPCNQVALTNETRPSRRHVFCDVKSNPSHGVVMYDTFC